jgi:DNA-binding NtrC family response regulator
MKPRKVVGAGMWATVTRCSMLREGWNPVEQAGHKVSDSVPVFAGTDRQVLAVGLDVDRIGRLQGALGPAGIEVETVTSGEAAVNVIERRTIPYEAVLLDGRLPGYGASEILRRARADEWGVPVIVLVESAVVANTIELILLGAFDVLAGHLLSDAQLVDATRRAVTYARAERVGLVKVDRCPCPAYQGIVGASPTMREVFAFIEAVAPTDATVLIRGELGTGKELVARAIHGRSARAEHAFVPVKCASVVSHTGALGMLLERSRGGTLFLDELTDLSADAQAHLVRLLEEQAGRSEGSDAPGARITAATRHDLAACVRTGSFREDLYYRLHVLTVDLPALRDRQGDLSILIEHFARKHAARFSRAVPEIHPSAAEAAASLRWPGNIRELENAIERAVILGRPVEGATLLEPESVQAPPLSGGDPVPPLATAKRTFEREYLAALLARTKGSRVLAARLAGLDPSNLRRLLRRHGLS